MKHKYSKIELDYVINNYSEFGAEYCALYLELKEKQILKLATRLQLKLNPIVKSKLRSEKHTNRIFSRTSEEWKVDPYQFINPKTKEVAYVLGYLWADGWIAKNDNVSFQILSSDMDQIKHIFYRVGTWNEYSICKKDKKNQTKLSTTNRIFYNFLCENDYKTKSGSSACKILSLLPTELQKYWMRGFLDGDGCIYIPRKNQVKVQFTSVKHQDWTFLENFLHINSIKFTKHINIRSNGFSSSIVSINRYKDAKYFLDYLYDGYDPDNIGLIRKYNKYCQLV